jgi:hypothetical protein
MCELNLKKYYYELNDKYVYLLVKIVKKTLRQVLRGVKCALLMYKTTSIWAIRGYHDDEMCIVKACTLAHRLLQNIDSYVSATRCRIPGNRKLKAPYVPTFCFVRDTCTHVHTYTHIDLRNF